MKNPLYLITILAMLLGRDDPFGFEGIDIEYTLPNYDKTHPGSARSDRLNYQNPMSGGHIGYHNKTIPLGCRESRKSLYGEKVKAQNRASAAAKGLEKKV